MPSSLVQQANAAVEETIEDYSDELDDELDDSDRGEDVDFGDRLPIPASYNRTLLELYQLVKDERYMNIDPEYQRDVVWTAARMTHLIDSLFRNFYVPPLIFKVTTGVKPGTTERRRWRVCIDGKQRLTTIRKFFDGEIPYIDERKQKWYYCDPTEGARGPKKKVGSKIKLLSAEDKDFINNVAIVNIEYEKLTEEQEEDMFQRVQLGVPLTVAEKLAAYSGEIPDFINTLRTSFPKMVSLVGSKRSTDFLLITELLLLLHDSPRDGEDLKLSTAFGALQKFIGDKDYRQILTPGFRARVRRVFTKYEELITTNHELFTHVFGSVADKMRKFSPIEFLGVGVLLDANPERPTRALVQDIKEFRVYLRAHFHDLRSNARTWEKVMEYVNTLERNRGYFPPENEMGQVAKRARVHPALASPKKNPAWNPPPQELAIPTQSTSTLNERQRQLHDARAALRDAEQRDAFARLPPTRPIANQTTARVAAHSPPRANNRTREAKAPDFAGGVQERNVSGSRKRTADGMLVKREQN